MKVSIVPFIIKKIKSALGIVQDTDIATQAISKGKYVFWKGTLKKASSAISQNDTLSASNLADIDAAGALNELSDQIGTLNSDLSGKKNVQTAKASPTASGSTLAFIDTISQDAQGVITATKKNVSVVNNLTTSDSGYVLDARQGKELKTLITNVGNKISGINSISVGWDTTRNAAQLQINVGGTVYYFLGYNP